MTEKRFTYIYDSSVSSILIIDNEKKEPNRWNICNVKETVQNLNELNDANKNSKEQLGTIGTQVDFLSAENQHMNNVLEENKGLKIDNKRLIKFIKSKGYSITDYFDWLQNKVWKE